MLLDEYQDTNPAQRVLLSTIFGDGFPVIAVGDEDQTIYEWRGASSENFELFADAFPGTWRRHGHDKELSPSTGGRRQVILDVANEIRRMANPAAETCCRDDPDATRRGDHLLGRGRHRRGRLDRAGDSRRSPSGDTVVGDGRPLSQEQGLRRRRRLPWPAHEIPVEVANLGGLLSVPEVAELRAWLTIIERPEDSGSLVQVLFGSRYRLGLADIAPLSRWVCDGGADIDEDGSRPR